ncbi:MAG: MMPL family transporter [Glaciecola sp.]
MFSYPHILRAALARPRLVYTALIIMVLAASAMIPRLNIDTDPENMLSAANESRVFHNHVKSNFAMKDMIVVGAVAQQDIFTVPNLRSINALSDAILNIEGVVVDDVLALNTVDNITQFTDDAGNNNGIRFEYLMKDAPTTQAQAQQVKIAVERLPMLSNTLVSTDNRAIAIYVPITSKDISYEVAEQIRVLVADLPTSSHSLDFHITGLPVAEDQFGVEMFVQMAVAAPLAGVAIFALLWYFFRNIPLIIAPMIVAMATVIITMGTLIGMGFTVHIMSSMIAIFLMPIAVVDSVHILSEFADRHQKGEKVTATLQEVMGHLFKPMLFTSITSAIGFYSLMLTPIPPVKVFGAFIGSGILLAFALTVVFVPVYISRLSEANLEKLHNAVLAMEKKGILSRALLALGKFAKQKITLILVLFTLVFGISVAGISKIEINDNPVNWFKADHEIRVADKVLNQHFAGTYDAWLVLQNEQGENSEQVASFISLFNKASKEGLNAPLIASAIGDYYANNNTQTTQLFTPNLAIALDDLLFSADTQYESYLNELANIANNATNNKEVFLQPDVLNWMADFQQALVNTGLVGKANTLNDIVKTVNRELRSGTAEDFAIPSTKQGVAQTLLQYQSSHRPQDLWHFVSTDYQQSLMWLQLSSGDNQHTSEVVEWVNNYIEQHPAPIALDVNWAGKSYLNIVWQDAMVSGMADSLLSSFVIVFVMMVVLFRSFKYGVLAMLPLSFTITMIYGLIGWMGKAYDMPIAVLSALTLGLSIDFAIHFLQRARELIKQTGSVPQALTLMFEEPSRAISRNAIVIAIGFTPLLFSPLVPYITVGFFLASIMALSALVTLILLPALLMLGDKLSSGKPQRTTTSLKNV